MSYNQLYGDNKTLENQSDMAWQIFFFVANSLLISWKNYRHAYSFNLQEVFGDDLIDWDMIKIPSFCQILKWNQKLCIWLWWYDDRRDSFMKFHEIFKNISWTCCIESIFLSKEN